MKKLGIILLLLCVCQVGRGEDLVKRDGTVYKKVTIISADPVRMLIAYKGGGCQVEYKDLEPGTLSEQQQKEIAEGLTAYAKRQERLEQARLEAEKLRLEKEAYEREQLAKGLIRFEGTWMKPADRQEIMASRELDRLKQEREQVELAKQKAELRAQEQQLALERKRLEEYDRSRRYSYSYRSYPSVSTVYYHSSPRCYKTPSHHYSRQGHSSLRYPSGLSFSIGSGGSSIRYSTGSSSCRTGVSAGHGSGHSGSHGGNCGKR